MNASLGKSVPMRRVLGVAAPPRSPRGFHVAILTRCSIALFFASGCVSKPSYEQVSSAVEVEREAHRRTHMKLVEKESRLAALETKEASPGVIQSPAPTPTALACRETGEKERLSLALSAREAELLAEKHRTSTLQREKTALARSLDEKETELRALRQTAMTERVIPASTELARAPHHQDRDGSLGSAEDEANEMPFYVDADAPDPLPSEPTNAQP